MSSPPSAHVLPYRGTPSEKATFSTHRAPTACAASAIHWTLESPSRSMAGVRRRSRNERLRYSKTSGVGVDDADADWRHRTSSSRLALEAGARGRAVSRGRPHRHYRARCWAGAIHSLGVQFVVENKAGGRGFVGTSEAARAPADGYTAAREQHRRDGHQSTALREASLRQRQGLRAGFADRHRTDRRRRQSGRAASSRRPGAREVPQGESGQGQLCVSGQRRLLASGARVLQVPHRHLHDPNSVPGNRPGHG